MRVHGTNFGVVGHHTPTAPSIAEFVGGQVVGDLHVVYFVFQKIIFVQCFVVAVGKLVGDPVASIVGEEHERIVAIRILVPTTTASWHILADI